MFNNLTLHIMKKYILKTANQDGSTHGGFKWNLEVGAVITAPDWEPTLKCGNGLHGWLNGLGDGTIGYAQKEDAKWLVLETEGEVIEFEGKCKFESCTILHVGDRLSATAFLRSLVPNVAGMIGESIVAGDRASAAVGDYGTATTGNYGTATAGEWGTATAGDYGTATAGEYGTATAGEYGTATAGEGGTATAGEYGTATAGEYGIINIKYWDESRSRLKIGYIGEDGLEPNTPYKLNENFNFVKS
jgi:hypothetical protein